MFNLYQEILVDHYKNPRNRGRLESPSFSVRVANSSCGDEITCTSLIENSAIKMIKFEGQGCVISQATASLLSEEVMGMACGDVLLLDNAFLAAMIGMSLGPVRAQCAYLSLKALQDGIDQYMK